MNTDAFCAPEEVQHEVHQVFGIRPLKERLQRFWLDNVLPAERVNEEKSESAGPCPFSYSVPEMGEFTIIRLCFNP